MQVKKVKKMFKNQFIKPFLSLDSIKNETDVTITVMSLKNIYMPYELKVNFIFLLRILIQLSSILLSTQKINQNFQSIFSNIL
jgi:hypothetical protein